MNTLAYNTSKGAVITFTQALACEWGKYGINVNADLPGLLPSKMTKGTLDASASTSWRERAAARLGDDEDLKGITLLYASDAGKHITGQWLAVDGGVSVVTGG
jgi:gluconate 5-dehydrogenase